MYSVLKPCKGGGSFEAVPGKQVHLDMPGVIKDLQTSGYKLLSDAKVVAVFSKTSRGLDSLTVFRSGKLMIRCGGEDTAGEHLEIITGIIEKHVV